MCCGYPTDPDGVERPTAIWAVSGNPPAVAFNSGPGIKPPRGRTIAYGRRTDRLVIGDLIRLPL